MNWSGLEGIGWDAWELDLIAFTDARLNGFELDSNERMGWDEITIKLGLDLNGIDCHLYS